ncbi:hypothetical protein [Candidatus Darwinibacter acetoxidans]
MTFDVRIANPPMLISDSVGHGSRRTYAAVTRVSRSKGGFLDVVAVYSRGYCDQHEEVEILDGLLALLVVSAPVSFPHLTLAQFPEDLPAGWEDAWDAVAEAVLALPE